MSRGEWAFGLLMSLVLVIEAAVYAPWWLAAAAACLAGWWGCQAACLHLAAQIAELKLELTDIERAP